MTFSLNSIRLPNGVRLSYVEQGNSAGVPVVLLHGITDSWHSFERVLPHLPDAVHAFAISQRGHGDSDRPEAGYHPRHFASDLADFLHELGIGQAVIAGHSMGASIAHRFAIDYPGQTLGLVLTGSLVTWRGHPDFMELWDSAVSTLTDPVDPGFMREFQKSTLVRPVPPAFLETVVHESLKLPARVWKAVLTEGLLEPDFSGEIGKIQAPTLILWGDQDAMTGSGQEALTRAIPRSRRVVYTGVGHGLHWEEPERFAADLTVFVKNIAI